MLTQALDFLLNTFVGLFVFALLMRFYLQWFRAGPRNPFSQFLNALTGWIVLPARRFIPGLWGMDLASLVMAWFFEFLLIVVVAMLHGVPVSVLGPGAVARLCLACWYQTAQAHRLSGDVCRHRPGDPVVGQSS